MSDLRSLVAAAAGLRREGEPFLVATVVSVRGSSYRRPGARMLLTRERWVAGSVSGGCLEGDVIRKGWWRTEEGPALVTYDSTAQDDVRWGFGLGCDGVVEVLLERAGAPGRLDALAFLEAGMREQARAALATVFRGEAPGAPLGARLAVRAAPGRGELVEADALEAGLRAWLLAEARAVLAQGETVVRACPLGAGQVEVLIEAVPPPVRLFLLGAGHDAVPVAQLARAVGWEVVVCEPHARFATRERFPMVDEILCGEPAQVAARVNASARPVVIVMAHHYEQDRSALAMALRTQARYIGVLGPRRRTARMLGELGDSAALEDPRLHAPVGLALGAETPQEIALAMVAEVQGVLARAPASSLRERRGPIHAPPQVAAAAAG